MIHPVDDDSKLVWRNYALAALKQEGASASVAATTADKLVEHEQIRFAADKQLGTVESEKLFFEINRILDDIETKRDMRLSDHSRTDIFTSIKEGFLRLL
jgi:hypothetical protein